jgi:Ca2+-binding EF-hand superfamily protein
MILQETLSEARIDNDKRAGRNKELRDRLEGIKGEVQGLVGGLLDGVTGVDAKDVLSDAEIIQHLTDAYNKFDSSKDQKLNKWEFTQAWTYLGLKGTEQEVTNAFNSVDTDKSGFVDLNEFITTIKSERMAELSLNHILKKMGVHFDESQKAYDAYKRKAQRRRILKKTMEQNVAKVTKNIIEKLSMMADTPLPQQNDADAKMYQTLKDTFDAFDKDGSAEMGYPEYVETWKFLGRSGTEAEIKKSFDAVDLDGSRQIDVNEFMFSLMGEKAQNYGVLADLETLNMLLNNTNDLIQGLQNGMASSAESQESRAKRNAELRQRMKEMKNTMDSNLGNVIGSMMQMMGMDPMDLLTDEEVNKLLNETFKKFDKDNSGSLDFPEFEKYVVENALLNSSEAISHKTTQTESATQSQSRAHVASFFSRFAR